MEQSILKSTKKILGVDPDNDAFDLDILTHINGAFSTLTSDLGVGDPVFRITDDEPTWSDFSTDDVLVDKIKQYVYLKVRVLFDPPATSYTQAALEKQLEQLEWRISVYRENLEATSG